MTNNLIAAFRLLEERNNPDLTDLRCDQIIKKLFKMGYICRLQGGTIEPNSKTIWKLMERKTYRVIEPVAKAEEPS